MPFQLMNTLLDYGELNSGELIVGLVHLYVLCIGFVDCLFKLFIWVFHILFQLCEFTPVVLRAQMVKPIDLVE